MPFLFCAFLYLIDGNRRSTLARMSIAENIKDVKARIAKAGKPYGADTSGVQLIAVSKVQPPEKIQEALDAGHRLFGENRVQEAIEHWAHRRANYPDLRLHLIGPLQTNKVRDAVALFDMIESVDREKLARALAKEMQKQGRHLPCLVQVNTGEEEQKAGVRPADLPHVLKICREECGLDVRGLMCIPPVDEPPALHFALLRKLAHENGLEELSMGMSGDYEKAAALGTTYVRVGTAIFGERTHK